MTTIHIRRSIRAATRTSEALRYATLSGATYADLLAGRVIQCSEFLRRLGLNGDEIRSLRSWFGRYAAQAWRVATGSEPMRVWTVIDGHWRHVAAYEPASFVFPVAVASYRRMTAMNLTYVLAA